MPWHHLLQNPAARATRSSPPTHSSQGTRRRRGPTVPRRHVQSASPRRCSQAKYSEAEQIRRVRNPRREGSTAAPSTKLQAGTRTTGENQKHRAGDDPPPRGLGGPAAPQPETWGAGTRSCSFLFGLVTCDLQKPTALRPTLRTSKAENLQQIKEQRGSSPRHLRRPFWAT